MPQQPDPLQVKREERRIVEETEKAGGTVHEFNPDASPAEKAADAGKVVNYLKCHNNILLILCCLEHAFGIGPKKCCPRNSIGYRYGMMF